MQKKQNNYNFPISIFGRRSIAVGVFCLSILTSASVNSEDLRAGEYLAARLAGANADLARAAEYYDAVLAVDPDNPTLLTVASLFFLADGQVDRAVELSQRLVGNNDTSGTAGLLSAVGAAKRGNYSQASSYARDVPRTSINRLVAPMVMAWTLVGEGKVAEGLETLDELNVNAQYAPFKDYMTALINVFSNNADVAEQSFRDALLGGAGPRQVLAYGNFLEIQNQTESAIALYESFLEIQPIEAIVVALNNARSGTPALPIITSVNDGLAEVFYVVSISLAQENATNAARNFSRMATYLRADFDPARMVLAESMESEGATMAALEVLEKIAPDSAYSWEARMQISLHLSKLGRVDDAVLLLEGMIIERPNSTTAPRTLGDIFRTNQQYADAAKSYSLAIERTEEVLPTHWSLFYTRGTTYERSDQWDKAEADFLRALELEPDQPFVLNYLGYSWIEMGRNVGEATEMIQRAVDQQPAAGFIVDSLGWAYYKLGNYEDATKQLERALQLTPAEPTINDHLGDAYWKVGRKREAVFQWQRSLDLGPEEDLIPIIKDKIANGLGD